jgi:hypothetical protein
MLAKTKNLCAENGKTGKHQIVKTQNPEPLRLRIAEK